MTLHEAIEQVLKEKRVAMTSSELADAINSRHLYERQDKQPIKASQISARVPHYPELLKKEGNKISLVNW